MGKPIQSDHNNFTVTAIGVQRLKPRLPLMLTDASMVSARDAMSQKGSFDIIEQRAEDTADIIRASFTGELMVAVGRVVLVSLTIQFNCNLPRIHGADFDGYSARGVTEISRPVAWLVTESLPDYVSTTTVRVWVELMVNLIRPTLQYRVNLYLEPRTYDESRVVDASAVLDISGYQLKWGRGG